MDGGIVRAVPSCYHNLTRQQSPHKEASLCPLITIGMLVAAVSTAFRSGLRLNRRQVPFVAKVSENLQ